jgi:hypothetical protein
MDLVEDFPGVVGHFLLRFFYSGIHEPLTSVKQDVAILGI